MKHVITFCFLLIVTKTFSQVSCATDVQDQYLLHHSTEYKKIMENKAALIQNYRAPNSRNTNPDTISVVVHVIHLGDAIGTVNNPNDAAIQGMISNLNLFFNGTYPDPWGLNQSIGVDVGVAFKLADKDPNCQSTNGIIRVNGSGNSTYVNYGVSVDGLVGISQSTLANFSSWDNTRYLNIWLVNKIANYAFLGYGYYPTGGSTVYDGVILSYPLVGSHLVAHEVGHYFDLLHTFFDSNGNTCPPNNNCATDGDEICDTDPIILNTGWSRTATNPCTGNPYGNIILNAMGYSGGMIFTPGQNSRMQSAISTYRSSLFSSPCSRLSPKYFSLEVKNIECNKASLQWQTSQGQNNKGFSIEQSTDGIHFTTVAFIKGNGKEKKLAKYDYTTDNLSNNKYYFRLKQIGNDGKFEYSSIATASITCDKIPYSIYPNPIANSVTLSTNSNAKNDIAIYNMYGQIVKKWNNTNQKTFNLNGLANGTYTLIINGTTKLKFVKN